MPAKIRKPVQDSKPAAAAGKQRAPSLSAKRQELHAELAALNKDLDILAARSAATLASFRALRKHDKN